MITSILLLILGLLLIYSEFFLPGGIMGVSGAVMLIAAITVFTFESDSILGIAAFVAITAVALVAVIRLALWRVSHSHAVYLDRDQYGWYASNLSRDLAGSRGLTTTDLRPGGYITIDKTKYQAISRAGYLQKGTSVIVIAVEEESLIVKEDK